MADMVSWKLTLALMSIVVLRYSTHEVNGVSKLSEEDKVVLLQAHNFYRSLVAEHAANMEEMVWNTELENLAEEHANKCQVDPNSNLQENKLGFTTVGENQAISTSMTIDYHVMVGKWYEEGKHYDNNTNACSAVEGCQRYLQLIWATTTDVGCAIKLCQHALPNFILLVCHYSPGIKAGEIPYKVGPPCFDCTNSPQVCRKKLCASDVIKYSSEAPMEPIPHFILMFPDKNFMMCYRVQADKSLELSLITNELMEMTGYFKHYQDEQGDTFILLDELKMGLNSKDTKLPNHLFMSARNQELRAGDILLSVSDPQCITIMETQVISVPSKMDNHSEVHVKLTTLGLEFVVVFAENSQLQLIVTHISQPFKDFASDGLIGQFLCDSVRIEGDCLLLEGSSPIEIEEQILTNQPRAVLNNQLCTFPVPSSNEGLESSHFVK